MDKVGVVGVVGVVGEVGGKGCPVGRGWCGRWSGRGGWKDVTNRVGKWVMVGVGGWVVVCEWW